MTRQPPLLTNKEGKPVPMEAWVQWLYEHTNLKHPEGRDVAALEIAQEFKDWLDNYKV